MKIIYPQPLKKGDIIGIIAPSRPIYNYKKEITAGLKSLEKMGFRLKLGKNINKRLYYSAGTPKEKADDFNEMFRDSKVKAIFCATGGSSANQILEYIDWKAVKNNPKYFWGYSDISVLLLAIYKQTGLITFHGPDIYSLATLDDKPRQMVLELLTKKTKEIGYKYPAISKTIRSGKAQGRLLGGNITLINSLLGTKYSPDYKGAILFWEEIGESSAMLDFKLQQLKLAGVLDKISGMVIGHLSNCRDKKYPKDNRSISDIILTIAKEYKFPIIQVDYFGHDIDNFYTFPIGHEARIDTNRKIFELI
jgi:muramoyltetrapeptide carboxypeptidase